MLRWIVRITVLAAVLGVGAGIAFWKYSQRFEPLVREQVVQYLEQRFQSRVELTSLKIAFPMTYPWRMMQAPLRVTGGGLVLRFKHRTDLPPLVKVDKFRIDSTLGELWDAPRRVREVRLEGLEINVPSKRERLASVTPAEAAPSSAQPATAARSTGVTVVVDSIHADGSMLRIYPNDPSRPPREFDLRKLTLKGAGAGKPFKYTARLMNPKPEGWIETAGEFGPWNGDDPAQTPLKGQYKFENADLSTIRGIGGILQSTGTYRGVLRQILVRGETRTPDFHITASGNKMPLRTEFESIVDGTSGNTLLQPVRAVLGRTRFIARGGVVRKPGAKLRSVSLDVTMQNGRIEDLLRLATKGNKRLMEGEIDLRTHLEILPRNLAVIDKLLLDGTFNLDKTLFVGGSVQDKIDNLSRRAQGQPKNEAIDEVLSAIKGAFRLSNGNINFSALSFKVPGADVDLAGRYDMDNETIDMRGTAKLQAKASQTMTGWKRWALKPVDPFFSKEGAGTFLPIKITGTKDKPEFGLDRKKDREKEAEGQRARSAAAKL